MGLMSAGGGDDRLQVALAVWGIVISIVITALMPVLVPVSTTGYDIDDIYEERASLEMYTGESMINQSPFVLVHAYRPYTYGGEYHTTKEGWLYGEESLDENDQPSLIVDGVQQIGKTSGIKLDPAMKSSVPLISTTKDTIQLVDPWEAAYGAGTWMDMIAGGIGRFLSGITGEDVRIEKTISYPTWAYTGYCYEFDPMLRIATHTEDGEPATDTRKVDDAKLNIVWYDLDGQEGISGGLVLYNSKTNAILASYTAAEIVSAYNPMSQNASRFTLDFDGTMVQMWIKFDEDVIINNLDLSQSFEMGKWTLAFTCTSADMYLDLQNSSSFTASLGGMLDTYIKIFTLDLPDIGAEGNLVLWVLCVLPLGLAMILFLSRFGLAGLGAGILGAAFAGGVLL